MKIKKILFACLLLMTILYTKNVHAFSLGVSNEEEYSGISFSDENTSIATHGGAKSTIVVEYGNFWGDEENISKINVKLSLPSDVTIVSTEANANDEGNHAISGSNGNYNITFGNSSPDGEGLFVIKLPNPSKTTDTTVTVTATSYGANNEQLDSATIKVKYFILVKNNSCDSNLEVTLNTTSGKPTFMGSFIGDNYSLKTTDEKTDITLTPKSSKTKIFGVSENSELQELSNGKMSNAKLSIGSNGFMYFVKSECSREWEVIEKSIEGANLVNIDLDNYRYNPNLITLSIEREEKQEEPTDNRSKVNTLKTLTVSDIKFTFKPDIKSYVLSVSNKTESVTIKSTLTDSKSSYVENYGNRTVKLKEGENEVLIKVKAENGTVGTYTLKIQREKNDDGTLKSLKVNDKEISLIKNTLAYTAYVDNKVTKAEIKAEATDKNAKVEISELKELVVGTNKVKITVTAANDKKTVYELNIVRDKEISINSKLKSLEIEDYKLNFSGDVLEYTLHIEKNIKILDITATPEHEKATVEIEGNKKLKDGSIIKIKVTAEDKKTTTIYQITIDKQESYLLWIIIGIILVGGLVGGYIYINNKNSKSSKK